jgi:hypothetical protein
MTADTAQRNFCSQCGVPVGSAVEARFCANCGQPFAAPTPPPPPANPSDATAPVLNAQQLLDGRAAVDPRILSSLRGARELRAVRCLECGYNGPMPVLSTRKPWYTSQWVVVPLCFTGVGIVFILGLVALGVFGATTTTRCPNCTVVLGPVQSQIGLRSNRARHSVLIPIAALLVIAFTAIMIFVVTSGP